MINIVTLQREYSDQYRRYTYIGPFYKKIYRVDIGRPTYSLYGSRYIFAICISICCRYILFSVSMHCPPNGVEYIVLCRAGKKKLRLDVEADVSRYHGDLIESTLETSLTSQHFTVLRSLMECASLSMTAFFQYENDGTYCMQKRLRPFALFCSHTYQDKVSRFIINCIHYSFPY